MEEGGVDKTESNKQKKFIEDFFDKKKLSGILSKGDIRYIIENIFEFWEINKYISDIEGGDVE